MVAIAPPPLSLPSHDDEISDEKSEDDIENEDDSDFSEDEWYLH